MHAINIIIIGIYIGVFITTTAFIGMAMICLA